MSSVLYIIRKNITYILLLIHLYNRLNGLWVILGETGSGRYGPQCIDRGQVEPVG